MELSFLLKVVLFIFAYLLGSIPMGLIVVRLCGGVDPRGVGSGNIGATNVGRTSGKKAGIITLIADALKGVIPVGVAIYLGAGEFVIAEVGLLAILGHMFSVYLGFRGGKGVATACGIFIVISPASLGLSLLVFIVVLLLLNFVSAASMAAALSMPVFLYLTSEPVTFVALGVIAAILIVYKHSSNIGKLLAGTEDGFRRRS
ncbi:Acyl-phosphate:glycerol-3-phosphate O-acyltransferase PlsY (EC 2.3.1.n3) [hydrothermal vent metagenome]|uniref:Acyl-phosphate:glycerol-3-phosphate O-acyltransferase PlsY n=1 Tax=hydrothermal vent metagenome TaxID=652676 RepID=A0A3B0R515_9ZZZZ